MSFITNKSAPANNNQSNVSKKGYNKPFKKAVSLWFKTSASGKEYIQVCVTDPNGEETWVGLFPNQYKKTAKSPDYTGVEFIKDAEYSAPQANNSSPAPVAAVVPTIVDDIPF
jgi:hypothetical protein